MFDTTSCGSGSSAPIIIAALFIEAFCFSPNNMNVERTGLYLSWLDGFSSTTQVLVRLPVKANFMLGLIILRSSAPRCFFQNNMNVEPLEATICGSFDFGFSSTVMWSLYIYTRRFHYNKCNLLR